VSCLHIEQVNSQRDWVFEELSRSYRLACMGPLWLPRRGPPKCTIRGLRPFAIPGQTD